MCVLAWESICARSQGCMLVLVQSVGLGTCKCNSLCAAGQAKMASMRMQGAPGWSGASEGRSYEWTMLGSADALPGAVVSTAELSSMHAV